MSDSTKSSMSPSEGSDMSTSLSETSSTRGWDMLGGDGAPGVLVPGRQQNRGESGLEGGRRCIVGS